MSTNAGVLDAVRGLVPALAANPVMAWAAVRQSSVGVADALPDAPILRHVKRFVREHPVLATAAVLAAARLATMRRRR